MAWKLTGPDAIPTKTPERWLHLVDGRRQTAFGADGTGVRYSPGGQAVLRISGARCRYAANTSHRFLALVYSDGLTVFRR
jgi:hypothetical protein